MLYHRLRISWLLLVVIWIGGEVVVVSTLTQNDVASVRDESSDDDNDDDGYIRTGQSPSSPQEELEEERNITFPQDLYHIHQEPFRSYPCQPKRIHIAQDNNVNSENGSVSMTVSFSLDYNNCQYCTPRVVYGHDISPQGTVIGTNPLQFNYTSDESDGLYHSDWIYHIQLPELRAGLVKYWYRIVVEPAVATTFSTPASRTDIGSTTGTLSTTIHRSLRGSNGYYAGETKTYTFLTPPMPGQPTTLALVGDIGQTANSVRTLLDIFDATHKSPIQQQQHDDDDDDDDSNNDDSSNDDDDYSPPVSQLLIVGDMSYADSDPKRWTTWLELIEPLVRSTPLHVASGNHEIECDTTTNAIFVPYEHWFYNPNRIGPAQMIPIDDEYRKTLWHGSCVAPSQFQGVYNYGNSFYSYQHGLAHIIVLNSYTDCTVGSIQYQWLTDELKHNFHRHQTPWLLVAFHAPLYTTFLGHVNEIEAIRMKTAMEPLFVEHGVNFIISGHDHAYMRTHPLAFDKMDPSGKAPIHLILGAGGNHEGHPWGYRHFAPEKWVAQRTMQDYGYGNLFLANATHCRFHWVRDQTTENSFEDNVWLSNPHV